MSHHLASLVLSSSLLAAAALSGCAEHDARFADATPEQLDRAYAASTGLDLFSVIELGSNFAGRNEPEGCPAITSSGVDTVVTGGCVAADGARFDGSIKMSNLPGYNGDRLDEPGPGTIDLDFERTTADGARLAIAGRVEYRFEEVGSHGDLTGDVMIDRDGSVSISRVTIDCGSEGLCVAAPGSEIELAGLGAASVEGAWRSLGLPAGRAIVSGADELILFIGAVRNNDCVPYKIGDARGVVCPPNPLR